MIQKILKKAIVSYLFLLCSCAGNSDSERLKKMEIKLAQLDSINRELIKNKQNAESKNSSDSKKSNSTGKSNQSSSSRVLGTWKFLKMMPDNTANDNSMDHVICIMERMPNTKNTYIFHLWTGHDLILTDKGNNLFVGENAALSVKYKPNNDQLWLIMREGEVEVYKRLK